MSKKNKKQRKDSRTHAEKEEHADEVIRAKCINWDEEQPVRIQFRGEKEAHISRKVICKGIRRYEMGTETFEIIRHDIRAGYEVRLTENDIDAIRFFPCLLPDMKTIVIVAETMNNFRQMASDKQVGFYRYGQRTSSENGLVLEKQQRSRNKSYKENRIEVTPDTMVTCPNCGTKFRIGRRIAAED